MEILRKVFVCLAIAFAWMSINYFWVMEGVNDSLVFLLVVIMFFILSLPKAGGKLIFVAQVLALMPVIFLLLGDGLPDRSPTYVMRCGLCISVLFSLGAGYLALVVNGNFNDFNKPVRLKSE